MKPFSLLFIVVLSGCANISQSRKEADGTQVRFRAMTLFGNSAILKLDVDHKTEKTYGGLKIGSIESDTATDAIKALTEAAVRGAIKGATP